MKYINLDRLREIVPHWAADVQWLAHELDNQIYSVYGGATIDFRKTLDFWFDVIGEKVRMAVSGDDGVDLRGHIIIEGVLNPLGNPCQVVLPLNSALEGYRSIGHHGVYLHGIQSDVALHYIGVTKQRWHARLSQHLSSARAASPYVFHRALIHHAGKRMVHRLLVDGLPYENAMQIEEEFVDFTLYPKGMNMIPGGFAGIRYLSTLGIRAGSVKQRDLEIERLSRMPMVKGRPNPLCAARWQGDQDYVNRIICGHGGRLTVEQVRQIRLLSSFGESPNAIFSRVGAGDQQRVLNVLSGKYYRRVA